MIETYNIEKVLRLREGKYVILGKVMFVRVSVCWCKTLTSKFRYKMYLNFEVNVLKVIVRDANKIVH